MIEWNKVTWYSKLAAVIFFIGILPIWTFFLGMKFDEARNIYLQIGDTAYIAPSVPVYVHKKASEGSTSTTSAINTIPAPIDSGIKGVITIGPTCPVEKIPADPACADKPFAASLLITDENSGDSNTIKAGSDGKFSINLPPGSYTIKNASTSIYPRFPDQKITVYSHKFSVINIQGDSGIR